MRLRNKKTGEIVKNAYVRESHDFYNKRTIAVFVRDGNRPPERVSVGYNSLAELNKEWADAPEKPKRYWFINPYGVAEVRTEEEQPAVADRHKQFGNYFQTREEAEKAVEKLKAWKRLKDKGFRFQGWEDLEAIELPIKYYNNIIGFKLEDNHDVITDLTLLFGGEE